MNVYFCIYYNGSIKLQALVNVPTLSERTLRRDIATSGLSDRNSGMYHSDYFYKTYT